MALFTAFNGRLATAESRGMTRLSWADRPAARVARRLLRLPTGSAGVTLSMGFNDSNVADVWTRRVGRRQLVSRCWIDGPRFVEQFGPLAVVSDYRAVGHGAILDQHRLEFLGFGVPARLSPRLRTRTWRTANGTLVSATTLRGPSGRLLCRSVSAMERVAAVRRVPSVPVIADEPVTARIEAERSQRRELKLVG